MNEFFGFGGYEREPEGYFSWQHLTFVSCFMIVMVLAAVLLGKRNRGRDERAKNRVLIVSAILIDAFEIFKIIICCVVDPDPMEWTSVLPLYMCSIQLITIPLAAFSRGRVKEASLDFVFIFGIIGAVMGTYLAGQNYSCYPVLSFGNTVSAITHSISGFASLYIVISGMESMKKKNIPISFAIISVFSVMAYFVNLSEDTNYMFLMAGDGTPYDIFYNLVGGSKVLYPITVVVLFFAYIALFYGVYMLIKRKVSREENGAPAETAEEATVSA